MMVVNIFIHLSQFFYDHGIIHQSSCPHTPQQNGVAECKMHHLLEVTRALKFDMRVPKSYWSEAVLTTYHIINCMPSTILSGQIPYTVLSPGTPLFHLPPKIFGCVCYVHILGPRSDKLYPRSIKCVFLGYSCTQKGYQCYSPTLWCRFISVDVTFDESQSYFSPSVASDSSSPCSPLLPPMSIFGWKSAMEEKIYALSENATWSLVTHPPEKTTIGCRWVYTMKYLPDGSIKRLKARLVAKGYTQTYGVDYAETFSPIAKISSVRILISLAANLG